MSLKKLKLALKTILFWLVLTVVFTSITTALAFSETKADLIITLKIGNAHGGVMTYNTFQANQTKLSATDFGLQLSTSDFSLWLEDEFIPSSGFLSLTGEKSLEIGKNPLEVKVKLECLSGRICVNNFNLTESEFKEKSILLEPNKVNYLNFILVPLQSLQSAQPIVVKQTSFSGENYQKSAWITLVGKMAEKANLTLDWALQINDAGYYNQAINYLFTKVVNILNGFLIIALLLLAWAWNFSFLISTKLLRRALIYFVLISIVINFTLPINRLMLDLADSVQRSFLTKADGTMLTSKDILSVNLPQNWEGQIQDSWTQVGVKENFWKLQEQMPYFDFSHNLTGADSQVFHQVGLTPKGKTTNAAAYLTEEDCSLVKNYKCEDLSGSQQDCSLIDLPQSCEPNEVLITAICDNTSIDAQWIKSVYNCKQY